jgi:hypothetical protein
MRIALLPLDERPANTRYPLHIAAIANTRLILPPADMLPRLKQPGDRARMGDWVLTEAMTCEGIVASVDLLGYGGLITSRISHDALDTIIGAVAPLLRVRAPERPVFAFNVITRISNANSAIEEPDYWAEYGMRLYAYSRTLDRTLTPSLSQSEDETEIPHTILTDWLTRRARNHVVNLAMLREAALRKFDLLVISSDDTSPIGLSARERKQLEWWREALSTNPAPNPSSAGEGSNVLMYPGADDVGTALVARMINHLRGHAPRVFVHFTDNSMRSNIAPYEDRPIHQAVTTQIMAVGATQVNNVDNADVILVVSPPFERDAAGRDPRWPDYDTPERRAVLQPAVRQIAHWLAEGRRVAVADVAFANGAEPALVELLFDHTPIAQLAAYGGWNTAGNTLGTVLGAACVPCDDDHARQIALAHHLLEDWGYQALARRELIASPLSRQNDGWGVGGDVSQLTTSLLAPYAERIRAAGLPCTVCHVWHPWARTFEVDFELR